MKQRLVPRAPAARRQRGIVTAVVVLFLIATVVFGLGMMLRTSGGGVADAQREGEGAAALYLAESGLELARSTIAAAGTQTNALCTGLNTPASTALGRGSFGLTGVSTPALCGTAGNPVCTNCRVTSTGRAGMATRVLTYDFELGSTNGTSCDASVSNCTNASAPPPTWKLNLVNDQGAPAIGVFSMAARRQGNNTGAACTNAACRLEWNINSQNGGNSVGSMGNAVPIGVGGSYQIYQTLSDNFNVAEVGALFVGTGAGPSLTGPTSGGIPVSGGAAYWFEANSGSGGTVGKAGDFSGSTNDGSFTNPSTDTCTTTPATGTSQGCTNWCYGGDTLVFGVAAAANALTDELTSVTFGTDGTGVNGGQNVALTRVAKFPNSSIIGAPTNVFAEIWYARNADYLSNAAASSGGVVTASIGASFTAQFANGSANMVVTAPAGVLHVGDRVTCTAANCPAFLNAASNVTISTAPAGGGAGTYTLSASCANPNCGAGRAATTTSTKLEVTAVSQGFLSVDDTLTGTGVTAGTQVSAIVGAGNVTGAYTVNVAQRVASTTITANGATIHVTGGSVPAGGVPAAATLLAVRAGTGVLPAGATVLSSPAPTATLYKLSAVPTTRLVNATLCGGTCAYFRKVAGYATSTSTAFTITKTANTGYWGGGFLCLKGVTQAPLVVNSLQVANRRWQETPN